MHAEQTILVQQPLKKALTEVIICSAGLVFFSGLVAYPFPLKAAAFVCLAVAAFIISRNIKWPRNPAGIFGKHFFSSKQVVYYIIAFEMGIAGALYYRGSFGMTLLPAAFKSFVWLGMCIATMEELVFRGFIQTRLSKFYPAFAIVFAAFVHASYKASLFIAPVAAYHYSIVLFYTWSFSAFIIIGILRYYSKNIVTAIIVHAVFDLLVYAENAAAPWWVW